MSASVKDLRGCSLSSCSAAYGIRECLSQDSSGVDVSRGAVESEPMLATWKTIIAIEALPLELLASSRRMEISEILDPEGDRCVHG